MIACLIPVRNAEDDLPGCLESARRFADFVVALDDGSTDGTRALLDASNLVRRTLSNPVRGSYSGWNDSANRQRLLDEAGELGAEWIVFLDADERIDPDDAQVLRHFLESGSALPGCAYGLRLYRDWGDEGVDPRPSIVFRCFAWRPSLKLPADRLHPIPVPISIPDRAWLPTTIRMRHLHSAPRSEARIARYAEADPGDEWRRGAHDPDQAGIERVPWSARPIGIPPLAPSGIRDDALLGEGRVANRLAVLLPVRNGEEDLPGWLESVRHFADGVVALDDGSTDRTREILERSSQVDLALANPRRDSYRGWDDRANRQRLVDAATELGFDWLLFLDADERIDPDEAEAVRDLVDHVAAEDFAYGFRVFRMTGDDMFDHADFWAYRLFAARPGLRIDGDRLHLVPVPTAIPRANWLHTTIRIRHLAGLPERRAPRFSKYEEADPHNQFQESYANVLESGSERPWRARPRGLPILDSPSASDDIVVSAVVIARNNENIIERAVGALIRQECSFPFEVIVAVSGRDRTAAIVERSFPEVTVLEVPEPGLPGQARNAGLAVARGAFVTFPGSHVEMQPGGLEALAAAHEAGWALVTGTLLNANDTRAGWASYLIDSSTGLPGIPPGPLENPPVRCSYEREALESVGGFPEDRRAGEDTVVNEALFEAGYTAYRCDGYELKHFSPSRSAPALAAHHFRRGKAFGQIIRAEGATRRSTARFALGIPARRWSAISGNVREFAPELQPQLERARLHLGLALCASAAGTFAEALRPVR